MEGSKNQNLIKHARPTFCLNRRGSSHFPMKVRIKTWSNMAGQLSGMKRDGEFSPDSAILYFSFFWKYLIHMIHKFYSLGLVIIENQNILDTRTSMSKAKIHLMDLYLKSRKFPLSPISNCVILASSWCWQDVLLHLKTQPTALWVILAKTLPSLQNWQSLTWFGSKHSSCSSILMHLRWMIDCWLQRGWKY